MTGPTQVTCDWTASATPVAQYALWRWRQNGDGSDYAAIDQSPNGLHFVDDNAVPGTPYEYRVFTTNNDSSQGPFSNRAYISCCN